MMSLLFGLITFLVGCLVLSIIAYVFYLILGVLQLPDQVRKIAVLLGGLIFLVCLIILAVRVFSGDGLGILRL